MSRQRQLLRKSGRKTVTVEQAALQFTDFSVSLSAACRILSYAVLPGNLAHRPVPPQVHLDWHTYSLLPDYYYSRN